MPGMNECHFHAGYNNINSNIGGYRAEASADSIWRWPRRGMRSCCCARDSPGRLAPVRSHNIDVVRSRMRFATA